MLELTLDVCTSRVRLVCTLAIFSLWALPSIIWTVTHTRSFCHSLLTRRETFLHTQQSIPRSFLQRCSLFSETLYIPHLPSPWFFFCFLSYFWGKLNYHPCLLSLWSARARWLNLYICISPYHGCQNDFCLPFLRQLTQPDTDKLMRKLHQCCSAMWIEKTSCIIT